MSDGITSGAVAWEVIRRVKRKFENFPRVELASSVKSREVSGIVCVQRETSNSERKANNADHRKECYKDHRISPVGLGFVRLLRCFSLTSTMFFVVLFLFL